MRWSLWALGGLLGAVLLVMGISWLLPVPAQEQAALEAMAKQPAAWARPQDNLFAEVWLLPYDGIAPDQRRALTEADVARHAKGLKAQPVQYVGNSAAEGRFPRIETRPEWCKRDVASCLAQVRAHADEVAAYHAGHEGLHARIAALNGYGYYRSLFDMDPGMPMPSFAALLDGTSAHALAHVRGDSTGALQGICRDVSTARTLMRSSDSLVAALIGGAWAEREARLFTEILAELPADAPVPAQCTTAFAAPHVAEIDLCEPLRGEFAFQASAMTFANVEPYQRWMFNPRKTQARTAWLLSRSCGDAVQEQIRQDRAVTLPDPPPVWNLQCAGNVVGCILMGIETPSYDDYIRRMQNHGAQLRLAGVALWFRQQPGAAADVGAALMQLPAELQSPMRPVHPGGDARSLEMVRHDTRDGQSGPLRVAVPMIAP